jgi:hypothetical protein
MLCDNGIIIVLERWDECCGLDWSGSEWEQVESSCELGNEPSGSIKCWEVLEWLHNWGSVQLYRISYVDERRLSI